MALPPITLIYIGKVPAMNALYPSPWKRFNLKTSALKQFGIQPFPATEKAHVTITRVLGKRERLMDDDNLKFALKGLRDSLKNQRVTKTGKYQPGGNYIMDDDARSAQFLYRQDETRRHLGPRIEVFIQYLGDSANNSAINHTLLTTGMRANSALESGVPIAD